MVIAGVARKLPEKVYCDRDGAIVDEEKAFHFASEYKLLHPEMVVTVDETGANTTQKSHGHLAGELFIVGSDQQEIGQLGAATNIHFTVLVFTAATGEPVMVAMILKSDKSRDMIPLNWSMGLDFLKIKESTDGRDLDSIALMQENKDAMCGGSTCVFHGKKLPCHVNVSPNMSITSKMLAEMLSDIHRSGVFGRLPGQLKPFLILDGHISQFELPFLLYVNGPEHSWAVCIGVSYGTHIRQVADS
jgi:hypothetical protein